jgi:hypothetical protein
MAWSLSSANRTVAHVQRMPTVLRGSSDMPSRCCMAAQNSASFSSKAGAMGRAVSHDAADAWQAQLQRRARVLNGHGGRIDRFQKRVEAVLHHVLTEGALRLCDGGHVGRICGELVRFPQSVCHVVQGLPLLSEPSTHTCRSFKRPKGGGPSLHCTLCCGGGREVCCSPFKVVGVAEAETLVAA